MLERFPDQRYWAAADAATDRVTRDPAYMVVHVRKK